MRCLDNDIEQIVVIIDKTNSNLEDLANEVLKIAKAMSTLADRLERVERLIDQKVM